MYVIYPFTYTYKYIYIIYMFEYIIHTVFIIYIFECSPFADSFSRSGRAVTHCLFNIIDSTGIFDQSR